MEKEIPIHISYTNLLAIVINPDGQIRFIAKPFATLLGYEIEELIGSDVKKIFATKELIKLKKLLGFLNKKENLEFQDFPFLIKTKLNQPLDLNLKVIQLKNNFLGDYSYAIISDNIIYQNSIKQIFQQTKHNLSQIYKVANELILILNLKKQIIYFNNKWQSNFGFNNEINSNKSLNKLFKKEVVEKIVSQLDLLTVKNSFCKLSLKIKSKLNNKTYYLKGYITLEQKARKPFIFQCIFNDVSEDVRSEKVKSLYYNISSQIIENTDLNTMYKNIHSELKEVIDCDNLYIALHNPEDGHNQIHFPYFIDKNKNHKSGLVRTASNRITEYAIRHGKPLSLSKEEIKKLNKNKEIDILGDLPEHWIGVPLHIQDNVIGVIAIQSYIKDFEYTNADLNLLDFASSQIAMAIAMTQTREELQNQTAQLNAIFDSSSHLIWSVNKELEVTSFNKNYFEANFINHDINPELDTTNDQDHALKTKETSNNFWEKKYDRAFRGEKLQFEINLKDDNNNVIWKEIYLNPIYTRTNKIEAVSGIAQDITPKKHSELALLKSEEKFRNIFESFQDLYFRCNLYGSIIMVSPSIYDLLGYHSFEVINKHIDDYYLYNPRAKKILNELKNEKNLKNVEVSIVKKNGEVRQCICNIRMVQNNKNEPFEIEGVVRDITQLKITNQQLITANEISENSLRVKEQFLANMSHEIRTPMNGIIGMIDLLDQSKLAPSQHGYVGTLKKSSNVLMDILNSILDLAKIEAGRMELKKSTFSLPNVVDKILALFTPVASSNGVSLNYHINKSLPKFINTDETRLIQVLSNLISNSLKFTKKGGSIDIGFELIDDTNKSAIIRVDVRDSGIGISEENQKLLFRSFEQLDNSTTKPYGGTGLGLAISKQLVNLLGGQIGVFSNPGLGSTFWFTFSATLPNIQPQYNKPENISNINMADATTTIGNKKVLVVDDNLINREVASEILKKAGCNVQVAINGDEAIELVKKNKFDVILMDIQMPGMDGIETTTQIRKLLPNISTKIIAMTAYAMKEDKERFLKLGMDDYLPKPIRAIKLVEKVAENSGGSTTIEAKEKSTEIINQKIINQLIKYGGEDIIDLTFNEFKIETAKYILACKTAIKKQEWNKIKKLLHTIKGTSGTLGIDQIAQTALNLETLIKENNKTDFEEKFLELIKNFDEFKDTFKGLKRKDL